MAAAPPTCAERLAATIAERGPIPVSDYMAAANAHYYATRDPLGAAGDFVTAPEISQMFGELVGVWLADLWDRAGRPANVRYVELGPGRGTLAEDAARAMRGAGLEPPIELVETSPKLREAQAERLPAARWHDALASLPDGPLLVVANEFFDALPVRQLVQTGEGWSERCVGHDGERFVPAPSGTIAESSPAGEAVVRDLAGRLARQGGGALIIDYGYRRSAPCDTLQAVSRHGYADPWQAPGESDLTAHVDFEALAKAASVEGVRIWGPCGQGEWLAAMGIDLRAAALAKAAPERAAEVVAARRRLTAPDQMGELFKVLALTGRGWPEPAGFA